MLRAFLEKHPQGRIEQSFEWGSLQCTIPGRNAFYVFGCFDYKKLVGSALVIRQLAGFKKHWLWCPNGPVLGSGDDSLNDDEKNEVFNLLKVAILNRAHREKDMFVRFEPSFAFGEGVQLGSEVALKDTYYPRNSLVLNLALSEEGLMKQMTQKGRYNIRKAKKNDVYVRKGDLAELDDFYDILKETAGRDGFHLHAKAFYRDFVEQLEEDAHFYVAHVDDDMVGGILVTHFGGCAKYYFGASSGAHRNKMPQYALQWFAILFR